MSANQDPNDPSDPLMEERVHRTPRGGVRSEAYYMDDEGGAVPKSKATRMEIVEFDAKGEVLHRTYGYLNRGGKASEGSGDDA